MVTEIINLVELIRQLAQRKSELDKEYFENFIQPVWEAFVSVHKNYKDTITGYLNFLSSDDLDELKLVDDVLKMMKEDSLLSSDLRSELSNLIEYIPSAKMKVNDAYLLEFIKAIYSYFDMDKRFKIHGRMPLQNLRGGLISTVERLSTRSSREPSINKPAARHIVRELCETLLQLIQNHYDATSDAYYRLKSELLG